MMGWTEDAWKEPMGHGQHDLQQVCAYATRRRRLIPDPVVNVQDGKENRPPPAAVTGSKRKADVACPQFGAAHDDGLPLLALPGLRKRSFSLSAGLRRESEAPSHVMAGSQAPGRYVIEARPAEAMDRRMTLAMEERPAQAMDRKTPPASRELEAEHLSSVRLVSGPRQFIHRLQYIAPPAEIDEDALSAVDQLLQGHSLGKAVERAVHMEMASVSSKLALPDGSDCAELEYKGYVVELLKLIGRRALERMSRRIREADPPRPSAAAEVLQRGEGRGSTRQAGASQAQLQELKCLMYEDACAREEYRKIEEELQEVEMRLEELAGAPLSERLLCLNPHQALAGLL